MNRNKWYQKKDGSKLTSLQIHGRTKNYPNHFNRSGTIVSLAGKQTAKPSFPNKRLSIKRKTDAKTAKLSKDEHYVLDLCDKVLRLRCSRQHKFDFLLGDLNAKGTASKLPVDGYYEQLKLAVEYRELQHTEAVKFFDKPDRLTISGVHRGDQRKIYDERRRNILPKNGIKLIEISYLDFNHDKRKRIIRELTGDTEVIKIKLHAYLKKINKRSTGLGFRIEPF